MKTIHDIQLALCEQIVNLCELYNYGLAHSFPTGGKRCMYARITGAIQAAKTCGFYIALARNPHNDQFAAVCVWETEYDTRITKVSRNYDLFGDIQTIERANRNPRTWIYCTYPHGTWGNIDDTRGTFSANIAFTGMYNGTSDFYEHP